jgi:hypothetical protein
MRILAPILLAGVATATSAAVILNESFESDPFAHGWSVHGDTNLFHWDATNQYLRVVWDSSRTNSFCHLPLNTLLTRADSFEAAFDVWLEDIAIGTTAGKPDTFPLAVSVFNLAEAQRTNLFIGSGVTASGAGIRSAMEFNYFPTAGFGETFAAIAVSATPTNYTQFKFHHDYPTPLTTGIWHRITLAYSATNQQLVLTKTRAGLPYGAAQTVTLDAVFGDFLLDTVAISSYSDKIGRGSLLAHGVIDNLSLTLPEPPVADLTLILTNGSPAQVRFLSQTGWDYTLERGTQPGDWSAASAALPGNGNWMTLMDTNTPADRAFYRVSANRP